jgi:hypothetical protein
MVTEGTHLRTIRSANRHQQDTIAWRETISPRSGKFWTSMASCGSAACDVLIIPQHLISTSVVGP